MPSVHPNTLLALSAGIQSEVASYVFYLEASKQTRQDDIRKLLEKLALEEKAHFNLLERQHHNLVKSEKWISTADIMKRDGLPEVGEDMAEEHRELIEAVRGTSDVMALLDIAYRLEEDAHDLFAREAARSKTPAEQKIFEDLARFEKGHMAVIQDMKKKYA
ncbi:ferritin family protein [bacterium]|nr:ferritin family protein [bacterium]